MSADAVSDTWEQGSPYERYIGRWSRRIAPGFLAWLDAPANLRWLDVGCGTGALSAAILDRCTPSGLMGVDPSEGFLGLAAQHLGPRALLRTGSATALPLDDGSCDMLVSGLVLNFIHEVSAALAEMKRVTAPGGAIAAYVWDYADRMEIIKRFWDVAAALDPEAARLHEGVRFPLCQPDALQAAFEASGLDQVATTPVEVTAKFPDFDDYWAPFLGGQGPAPAYLMSRSDEQRAEIKARLAAALAPDAGRGFSLAARAWAVRGRVPDAT